MKVQSLNSVPGVLRSNLLPPQITLPGHADYSAQGGGPNRNIAEEKACDELVQYLQVSAVFIINYLIYDHIGDLN